MTDSKTEPISMKNTEKKIIQENINIINNNINISKKSLKESIKKENSLDNKNLNTNANKSYNNEIKWKEINLNDISIKSLRTGNIKIYCEFIGKNYTLLHY